jgi:hypothetical protein
MMKNYPNKKIILILNFCTTIKEFSFAISITDNCNKWFEKKTLVFLKNQEVYYVAFTSCPSICLLIIHIHIHLRGLNDSFYCVQGYVSILMIPHLKPELIHH